MEIWRMNCRSSTERRQEENNKRIGQPLEGIVNKCYTEVKIFVGYVL